MRWAAAARMLSHTSDRQRLTTRVPPSSTVKKRPPFCRSRIGCSTPSSFVMVTFIPLPITSSPVQSKLDAIRMTAPPAVAVCSSVKLETRTSDVGLGVVGAGVGAGVGGITQHPHWLAPQLPG